MNTGEIVSRYTKAFLEFVGDAPDADPVFNEVMTLVKAMNAHPKLRQALSDPVACTPAAKMELLKAALGGNMDPRLERFISMVIRNGRTPFLRMMLYTFLDKVFHRRKILRASLVTAVPSGALEERIRDVVGNITGCSIMVETHVDPSLIGGFMLTIDDERIDASVKGQLDTLRRQFVEQNRRLV